MSYPPRSLRSCPHGWPTILMRPDEHNENAWALASKKLQPRFARSTNERASGATAGAHDILRERINAARRYEPLPEALHSLHALGFSARGMRLKS
jgi:hypothetical protein